MADGERNILPQNPPPSTYGDQIADEVIRRLPESTATWRHTSPPRRAVYGPWPAWLADDIRRTLSEELGIPRLYRHQASCAEAAHRGRNVIITTGTASGKSLAYLLPVLSALHDDPRACALYVSPTKALANNQLAFISRLCRLTPGLERVTPSAYDGDTPQQARRSIRDDARLIVTNPEMIHLSFAGAHQRWTRFLRNLSFIVIDECHTCRGVFGAHIALVIRRLVRVARRYGADPTIIMASATTRDPVMLARRLTGQDAVAITTDDSPAATRTTVLWEPGFSGDGDTGDSTRRGGPPVRIPAYADAAEIMATAITEGARTLVFARSRRQAEIIALRAHDSLALSGNKDLAGKVAAYRAGYLAGDRRRLEQALDDGELVGVAATTALELGIDIGGLDCVVVTGWPGTVAGFTQQAGRAGRRGQSSLVVLVARDDPLDMYLIHHPEAVVDAPVEKTVFNPSNPYVLSGHLLCACVELPLSAAEVRGLDATAVAADLVHAGLLRWRGEKLFAVERPLDDNDALPTPRTAHRMVNLRGGTGQEITIIDCDNGAVLGTVGRSMAFKQVHAGAVYLHMGDSYVVEDLDLINSAAFVRRKVPDFSTVPMSATDIRIVADPEEDTLVNPSPGLWVAAVDVEVTTTVTGYRKKLLGSDLVDTIALDLPPDTLFTRAVSYTLDPAVVEALGITAADLPGALHAAEHAAIGLLPLVASCDRWDIGGVSTALHADTGLPTVFVYDGYPGGAGFADCGFERFHDWITATCQVVKDCPCTDGCPSCVQSPKCGNGNSPLSKSGAVAVLSALSAMTAGMG
ncbi:DEAD/DEAH box helicase [Corynebacterium mendelii]|uniref:DEAD/DEAH box helicase n=1 Tax=Corynebacterium mendelii TaxID=2765362 RepID=UPI002ED57894